MARSTRSGVRSSVTDDEFGGFRISIPPSVKAWLVCGLGLTVWLFVLEFTVRGVFSKPGRSHAEAIKFLCMWVAAGIGFGGMSV